MKFAVCVLLSIALAVSSETPSILRPGLKILKELETKRVIQPGRELLRELDEATSRVVGGTTAADGAWPWQVSLQRSSLWSWSHICGGSLIDTNWVLTAAHCVDGQNQNNLRIVAGVNNLGSSSAVSRSISQIIKHPQYGPNSGGYPNDIALIQLSSSFTLSSTIQLATLPATANDEFYSISDCYITGWGRTSGSSNTLPQNLMEARMANIQNSECRSRWSGISGASILSTHICPFEEGKSACNGDSGGPYVCSVNGKYVLAGVTSWGISTCDGSYPSVYVRVSKYLSWFSNYIDV